LLSVTAKLFLSCLPEDLAEDLAFEGGGVFKEEEESVRK
jgi:hypothetical protein